MEKAVKDEKNLMEIIIPGEIISELFPVVQIKKEPVDRILHGQPIYNKDLMKTTNIKKDSMINVFCVDKFIGVFRVISENEIFAKPEFVLQPLNPLK